MIKYFKIRTIPIILAGFILFVSSNCKEEESKPIPVLTTSQVTDITQTSATCGGNIITDAGLTVIVRGICWSTGTSPTISDNNTTDGAGAGSFTSTLTNLIPNTTYFVRAYATNSAGTGYGMTMAFTSLNAQMPVLTTSVIIDIKQFTATCGGNIISDGGLPVTERGVCWSTSSNPTLADSITNDGSGTGVFTSLLAGLTPGTSYYVRAYATNIIGTFYGNELSFAATSTGETTFTDISGNVYNTVTIGTQVWMAENLKTTKYNDNSTIPLVEDAGEWGKLFTPGYCYYNNEEATYKITYGALYNWYTVNTGKLCPTGWHVPTDSEWTTLTDFVGSTSSAGGNLKETGFDHWLSPNTGATDSNNFTALPGGFRANSSPFEGIGIFTYWWSSTSYHTYDAWFRNADYDNATLRRENYDKQFGFSIRCIKD